MHYTLSGSLRLSRAPIIINLQRLLGNQDNMGLLQLNTELGKNGACVFTSNREWTGMYANFFISCAYSNGIQGGNVL